MSSRSQDSQVLASWLLVRNVVGTRQANLGAAACRRGTRQLAEVLEVPFWDRRLAVDHTFEIGCRTPFARK